MIAKNIAPWLRRAFAFERLNLIDWETSENERALARKKTFDWDYWIYASDIDQEMVELSKENATRAWLAGEINFEQRDFKELLNKEMYWTLVSNPPYWDRLKEEDIKWMYNNIDKLFRLNPELWGWIISSYLEFDGLVKKDTYKKRKLYNWWEKCYFWRRK